MRMLVVILFKWFFYKEVTGCNVSDWEPEKGRFSRRQLKIIYLKIIKQKHILQKAINFHQWESHGNRLMVFCGIMSLAAYKVMRLEGLSHQYATKIIGDVIWKLYIFGTKPIWLFSRLLAKDSQQRLNITLRFLCKYPFSKDKNGYQYEIKIKKDHMAMDFHQCVVFNYMHAEATEEELDFFRNSWCLYDFALPGYLIDGGNYKREHTLSHGDKICDMKWYAKTSSIK